MVADVEIIIEILLSTFLSIALNAHLVAFKAFSFFETLSTAGGHS